MIPKQFPSIGGKGSPVLRANPFTNIKPNRGQPFNPNPNGVKGNVNSNGIGGGGAGAGAGAAAAGGIARAGGAAAASGGAAPFIVGGVGFGVGVALGDTIYKEAENPDSIVFKTLDVIDRKLKGGDSYKLGNESKTRSHGGVQVSPEILPFGGGQVADKTYLVRVVHIEIQNFLAGQERVAGVSDAFGQGVYVVGPVGD